MDEDVYSAIEGGVYHLAIPADESPVRLRLQRRIAAHVSALKADLPLTEGVFRTAARYAGEGEWGEIEDWTLEQLCTWSSVAYRMWRCVEAVQFAAVVLEDEKRFARIIGEAAA